MSDSGKTRTFKPRKDVPEGTKQYQLRKYAEATLVGSNLHNGPSATEMKGLTNESFIRLGIWKSEARGAVARRRGLERMAGGTQYA